MDNIILERLDSFKNDLTLMTVRAIIRKHIVFGECFALNNDRHYDLREKVATHFSLHPNEVLLVGSGKLGFSIAPTKRYQAFNDSSDIDIVLISSSLFDNIWMQVFNYKSDVGYWENEQKFKEYLFKGWIRPDMLPPSRNFDLCKDWWEFFENLSKSDDYSRFKIRAGLYKSFHFLESYQSICVSSCQNES